MRRRGPIAAIAATAALLLPMAPAQGKDGGTAEASATAGPGYLLENAEGILHDYTIHLVQSPGIESLRSEFEAAAAQLSQVLGIPITVAPGLTTRASAQVGEVMAVVSNESSCGWLDAVIAGCGSATVWGLSESYDRVLHGHVWITPDRHLLDEAKLRQLVLHELGHAFGLGHYADTFEGKLQVMYPTVDAGTTEYQSGDRNGLGLLASRRPAGYFPHASWDAWVAYQLKAITGSAGTSSSRASAVSKLKSGATTPSAYIRGLIDHPWFEPQIAPLIRLYRAYFGRTPDNDGMRFWIDRRRLGRSVSRISQTFATSSEFIRKYGNLSNRAFVLRIYTDVLGRAAETGGAAYWTRKLDAGTSRGQVMINFSESNEYKTKMRSRVDSILAFIALFEAVPTSPDLAAAMELSEDKLVRRLLVSPDHIGQPTSRCYKYCQEIWPPVFVFPLLSSERALR